MTDENVIPIRKHQDTAAVLSGSVTNFRLINTGPIAVSRELVLRVCTGLGGYIDAGRVDGTIMACCRGDGRLDVLLKVTDEYEVNATVTCQRCRGRGCGKQGAAGA